MYIDLGTFNHDFLCTSIFYVHRFGASRGLVTIWDTSEVEVWASFRGDHLLLIHGKFIKSNVEFYLFNVYALCDQRGKQAL